VGGRQGGPAVLHLDADAVADEIEVLLEAAQLGFGDLRAAEGLVPLDRQTELQAGAGLVGSEVAVGGVALVAGDAKGQVEIREGRITGEAQVDLDFLLQQADAAELGAVLLLTEAERLGLAAEWSHKSERALAASGIELMGLAVGWYESASEEPGGAGALGELVAAADALHGSGGAWQRMRAVMVPAKAAKKGRAA
jgi:hypothetical protein